MIIPAYGSPVLLRRVLGAVSELRWQHRQVIVAIDGPDQVLEKIARDAGVSVVVLATNQGSYAARNAALDLLEPTVEIIAFTDMDCIPTAGWLDAHVAALSSAQLSGGAIDVIYRKKPSAAEYVDRTRHLRQELYVRGDGYAATANLAVRREIVERLRFDERLLSGGDNDFGRRALELGFSLVYTPEALVRHPARRTDRAVMMKVARIRAGMRTNPDRWRIRPVPFPPLKPKIARAAARETGRHNYFFLLHVWLLQLFADWRIHRTVQRIRQRQFDEVGRSRGLRVGYFVESYPKSSETFVSNEIEELQRTGVAIVVVAVRQADGKSGSAPAHFLQIPRHRLSVALLALRWAVTHPVRFLRFLSRVREISSETGSAPECYPWTSLIEAATVLHRQRVHVLHAHFAWGGAAGAYCVAALLDVKWSLTVHAHDIFAKRRNLELKLARTDRLVTVCLYNIDYLKTELGVRRAIDHVVCGVRLPELNPSIEKSIDVVAVGRLVSKKGFDVLIAAAALMVQDRPDLRVAIIGTGKLHAELEEQIARMGLGEHVKLFGVVPNPHVLQVLQASRVFCLPARIAADGDRDSMPVAIKEAMAAGTPIVATDVAAIPEMVDTTVGLLVPPEDPPALAGALARVLDLTDEQRQIVGAAARHRIALRMTLDGEVAKLREILVSQARKPTRWFSYDSF